MPPGESEQTEFKTTFNEDVVQTHAAFANTKGGGVYIGVSDTGEDLMANTYRSTPRNKLIADFFKDMGLIEKYGSGIGRIINYFKNENLPLPLFQNISDGFMVTVFFDHLITGLDNQNTTRKQFKVLPKKRILPKN